MSERAIFLPDILTNGVEKYTAARQEFLFIKNNKLLCSTGMEIC